MKIAQQEIRSTVTVNTIDLSSKKKDDDNNDLTVSVSKKRGKENWGCISSPTFISLQTQNSPNNYSFLQGETG